MATLGFYSIKWKLFVVIILFINLHLAGSLLKPNSTKKLVTVKKY